MAREFDGEEEREKEREQDERVVNDPIYTVTLGVPIDPTNQPTNLTIHPSILLKRTAALPNKDDFPPWSSLRLVCGFSDAHACDSC